MMVAPISRGGIVLQPDKIESSFLGSGSLNGQNGRIVGAPPLTHDTHTLFQSNPRLVGQAPRLLCGDE